jgi:hypothetical protein
MILTLIHRNTGKKFAVVTFHDEEITVPDMLVNLPS